MYVAFRRTYTAYTSPLGMSSTGSWSVSVQQLKGWTLTLVAYFGVSFWKATYRSRWSKA